VRPKGLTSNVRLPRLPQCALRLAWSLAPSPVGLAAQRRVGARPDRAARRDVARNRAEDRRAVAGCVLEQDLHGMRPRRQLGRVDVQRAVVDPQGAGLGSRELVQARIRTEVTAVLGSVAYRHRQRICAVDFDHRSEQASAHVSRVQIEVELSRPRLGVRRAARHSPDRR
jgi:hypothetical protein